MSESPASRTTVVIPKSPRNLFTIPVLFRCESQLASLLGVQVVAPPDHPLVAGWHPGENWSQEMIIAPPPSKEGTTWHDSAGPSSPPSTPPMQKHRKY